MKSFLDNATANEQEREAMKDALIFGVATLLYAAHYINPPASSTRTAQEVTKTCITKAQTFVDEYLKRKEKKS